MTVFLIKGKDKIAEHIGVSPQSIPLLVKNERLPAFQKGNGGAWLARPADLDIWSLFIADKYLPESWGEIRDKFQAMISPPSQGR